MKFDVQDSVLVLFIVHMFLISVFLCVVLLNGLHNDHSNILVLLVFPFILFR